MSIDRRGASETRLKHAVQEGRLPRPEKGGKPKGQLGKDETAAGERMGSQAKEGWGHERNEGPRGAGAMRGHRYQMPSHWVLHSGASGSGEGKGLGGGACSSEEVDGLTSPSHGSDLGGGGPHERRDVNSPPGCAADSA